MKKITLSLLACFMIGIGTLNASFPVKKTNNSETATETTNVHVETSDEMKDLILSVQEQVKESTTTMDSVEKASGFDEDDWILLALWFFLGAFAAHRWYAGKPWGWNILFILTAGGCGIWAIVDLINIIKKDFM